MRKSLHDLLNEGDDTPAANGESLKDILLRDDNARASTAPEEKNVENWSDVPGEAVSNLLPDAKEFGSQLVQPVLHPINTGKALASVGRGLYSKVVGGGNDADEATVNAIKDFYVKRYGSEQGWKNALAHHPIQVAADLAMLLSGTGAALRAPEMLASNIATRGLGAVGQGASKVADAVNPINAALNVAKAAGGNKVMDLAGKALSYPMAWKTGSRADDLNAIRDAGKVKNADAYALMTRNGDPSMIVDKAQSALQKLAQKRKSDYLQSMTGIKANSQPLSYSNIDSAVQDAVDSTLYKGVIKDPHANKIAEAMKNVVLDWQTNPNIPTHNIEALDALKQRIGSFYGRDSNGAQIGPSERAVIDKVYGAIKKTLTDADPNYQPAMGAYTDASDQINELAKTFALNKKANVDMQIRKIVSATGEKAGRKADLLAEMEQLEPGITPLIAGNNLSELWPHGLRGNLQSAALEMGVPALMMGEAGWLPTAAYQAANAVTGSPRAMGMTQYGLGRAIGSRAEIPTLPSLGPAEITKAIPERQPQPEESPDFGYRQSSDAIWNRMVPQESGGNQFDKSGRPLTSTKGAVGAAQIMPGTAPEAASLAGMQYDPNQLRTNKDYNLKAGRAYYDKLHDDFGDPIAAAAAYNAGPARVRAAQERAQKEGGSYIDYLPPETQNYVGSLQDEDRPQRASGGRITNHKAEAEKIISQIKSSLNRLNKRTEPILKTHDDAVATALKIADAHI